MHKFTLLLSALVLGIFTSKAQTVATFEDLTLPGTDTFYVNHSNSGADVGFDDGLVHFPCVYYYDSTYGWSWSSGFIYSNVTDSTTSGYTNNYSAKAYKGHNGSDNYVVVSAFSDAVLPLKPAAQGKPVYGLYITNGTYAYNSMRDGDFAAKKFNNTDKDWFKVKIRGYRNGMLTTDSIDFYLADFRHADSTQDYIVKDWQWVDLSTLGHIDSLDFVLSSTDNGQFGMNTPAYFCIDDLKTNETDVVVNNIQAVITEIYPNPADGELNVRLSEDVKQISLYDMAGRLVNTYPVNAKQLAINTSYLQAGTYFLQLAEGNKTATVRFVKR